jgi:hypothetical protein
MLRMLVPKSSDPARWIVDPEPDGILLPAPVHVVLAGEPQCSTVGRGTSFSVAAATLGAGRAWICRWRGALILSCPSSAISGSGCNCIRSIQNTTDLTILARGDARVQSVTDPTRKLINNGRLRTHAEMVATRAPNDPWWNRDRPHLWSTASERRASWGDS